MKIEINTLTGLYFSHTFFEKAEDYLTQFQEGNFCMVAIDFEHFRLFNKLYGRKEGDNLLVKMADILDDLQTQYGGVAGYLGGDNFGIIIPYQQTIVDELIFRANALIQQRSESLGFLPGFGIYLITDFSTPGATMYDRATLALARIMGQYTQQSCLYSPEMEEKVEEEIKLLAEVQEGIAKDEFTFFVQPQCDISNGKIVGGESLVRWIHHEKGLIPPGKFIPVLEKNGFIADLDRLVWKKVCQWLRSWIDKGYQPVPISINISRIDIFSMDVPTYLMELLNTYNLPTHLLKVEITESAYAEDDDKIVTTVKQLRDANFLVMMDDFGSGYSSLNMLKSIAVDVLKIDMRFLEISSQNQEKGIGILESVINMARQMRIPIVVEGVETQEQENFLLKMGCRYTQGYYYYKPMPISDFEKIISDQRKLDYNGIWCRQIESMHAREFLDLNLFNDTMVNNILGAAAFYDLYENNIEITRVNESYFKLAGISQKEEQDYNKKFWNHVRDDDRQLLFSIFAQAYENQSAGSQGYIHFIRTNGETLWIYIRVFFLREKEGHKLFYGSLTDMTPFYNDRKGNHTLLTSESEDIDNEQLEKLDKYYGSLPYAFGIGKILLDEDEKPFEYEVLYANKEAGRLSGGDLERLRYLLHKLSTNNNVQMLEKAYEAAYLDKKAIYPTYSPITGHYLNLIFYPYQYGYFCCMLQDITHSHIYENTMKNILRSYREVYFIHLQDNYYRMIYPDENRMLERGNYEESINRHFETGRILPYDEENIRRFLSLANLKEKLSQNDTIECKYRRRHHNGSDEWCLSTFNICEKTTSGEPKTAILTIRSIEALMREKEERRRQTTAEMLANMSDGFFIYQADNSEKILYANPTTLRIFGCNSMEEFVETYGENFPDILHPDDLNRVQWEIHEQLKQSEKKMDYVRYRIIRKDGETRWIDDCGHLEDTDENNRLFYVFISDITDTLSDVDKERLINLNQHYNN